MVACGTPPRQTHQLGVPIPQLLKVKVTQSCSILCSPLDCSPPGSSVNGILQVRPLEWVVVPFSPGSSRPRDQTQVFCIAGGFLIV